MLLYILFIIITVIFAIKLDHAKLYKFNKKSDKKIWDIIETYWPMVPYLYKTGHPEHNLWAEGGCLEKFDIWMKNKYNIDSNSRDFEKSPFFNWLINKQSGYYIPQQSITSTNFEQTSGVNINRNGKLDKNIVFELSEIGIINKDKIDSWWWGSCDLTAKASQLFEEPRYVVEDHGVSFSPKDIKGLLTIIAKTCCINYKKIYHRYRDLNDTVLKKDGTVITGKLLNFSAKNIPDENKMVNKETIILRNIDFDVSLKLNDGEEIVIYQDDIGIIKRETSNDIKASDFHNTITTWIDKPFAMDVDKGPEVWNYSYGQVMIKEIEPTFYHPFERELHKKFKKKYSFLNKFRVLTADLFKSDNEVDSYRYWTITGPFNTIIESGWISDNKPDFVWRCELNPLWESIEDNKRNPYVLPKYVKELYYRSIIF